MAAWDNDPILDDELPGGELVPGMIRAESRGNQSAVSPKGAMGTTQLMPRTAAGLGVNPRDKLENVAGGVSYLSQLRKKYGDDRVALAAYNWGPTRVDRWLSNGGDFSRLPGETRAYINAVMAHSGGAQKVPAQRPPQQQAAAPWENDPTAPEEPPRPAAPQAAPPAIERREVGAGEALARSAKQAFFGGAKYASLVPAGAAIIADKVLGLFGAPPTYLQDKAFKTFVDPNQRSIEAAQINQQTEQVTTPGAQIAQGVGGIADPMLPLTMMAGGGLPAAAPRVAAAVIPAMLPANKASTERYGQLTQAGVDPVTAAKAATIAGATALGMMAAPPSLGSAANTVAGRVMSRGAQGAGISAAGGMAGRSAENSVLPAENQQPVGDMKQVVTDALLGAAFGQMGVRNRPGQAPRDIAADRNAYDAARLQAMVDDRTFGSREAMGVEPLSPEVNTSRQVLDEINQRNAGIREAYDSIPPPVREESPIPRPPDPSNAPESVLAAFERGRAAEGMDLPPEQRAIDAAETRAEYARPAFDLAAKRQRAADADLANTGEVAPDYQAGAAAATGGRFDAGIRGVTLLDARMEGGRPVAGEQVEGLGLSPDGKGVLVRDGNGNEFVVDPKRLSQFEIPQNARMAQDFVARSRVPPRGVGEETMAGLNMPRRATDRISGDEVGGLATAYNPNDIRRSVDGTVEPPPTGGAGAVARPLTRTYEGVATDVSEPAPTANGNRMPALRSGDPDRGSATGEPAGGRPPQPEPEAGQRPEGARGSGEGPGERTGTADAPEVKQALVDSELAPNDRNANDAQAVARAMDVNEAAVTQAAAKHADATDGGEAFMEEVKRIADEGQPAKDQPKPESSPEPRSAPDEGRRAPAEDAQPEPARAKAEPDQNAPRAAEPERGTGGKQGREKPDAGEGGRDPVAEKEKSYSEADAKRYAKRMSQQGLPTKVEPHPDEPGRFALRPGEHPLSEDANLYDVTGYVGESAVAALKAMGVKAKDLAKAVIASDKSIWKNGEAPSEQMMDAMARVIQNKMHYVGLVQKAIQRAGSKIEEAADVVMHSKLYAGRAGERLGRFERDLEKPFYDAVKLAVKNKKITEADINDYLAARFAPIRNAKIAKINPELRDGGSGITNAQARETMNRLRAEGKIGALEEVAKKVDAMTAFKKQVVRDGGLLPKEVVDSWNDKHYVPLKGEELMGHGGTGSGFSVKGSGDKRATGRFDPAKDIVQNVIRDAKVAILRAEKAEVGRALLALAQKNPNKGLWHIDKVPTKATIRTGDDGLPYVSYEGNALAALDRERSTVVTAKDGNTYTITFAANEGGRLMARAMNNLGPQRGGEFVDGVTRALAVYGRFVSSVATRYNPEFMSTNFLRDIQEAGLNLTGEHGAGMAKKVAKDVFNAMGGFWHETGRGAARGSKAKEWQGWAKRFREAGGETHFVNVRDIEQTSADLKHAINVANGDKLASARDGAMAALRLVDDANGAVENAMRLSTFKHLVDAGLSEAKAAEYARGVTVDFNVHGELGPVMNSLYVFFNASVQGSYRNIRAIAASSKIRGTLAGAAVATYGLAELNRAMSDTDDDGVSFYDKIPTAVKNKWLVLMSPVDVPGLDLRAGRDYVKIAPLPFLYGALAQTGSVANDAVHGDVGLAAARAATMLTDSFNPFGSTAGLFSPSSDFRERLGEATKLAAPTFIDPAIELLSNRNAFGAPIYKEQNPFSDEKQPWSSLHFKATSDAAQGFAKWLNKATGGTDVRKGAIDIPPDVIDYSLGTIFGGAGRFVMRSTKAIGDAVDPEADSDLTRAPFVRLVAGVNRAAPFKEFKRAKEDVAISALEQETRAEDYEKSADRAALADHFKAAQTFVSGKWKEKQKIEADTEMSKSEKREATERIDEMIDARMKDALGRYYEAGGKRLSD